MTTYPKVSEEKLAGLSEQQAQQVELQSSVAGKIGNAMEPVIKPMGFDYRIGTALIGALAAKEVFVAQMGIVFSVGEADEESETLREKLRENYTSLQGFCVMLFCLISAPCIATVAVCRRETNSWKWALFQFFGLTVVAYVITVIVYQVGSLIY
jgi:ferrous iron transport protein B